MEALKSVSKKVGTLISNIVAALGDKKVSMVEGLGIFKDFSVLAWDIFSKRNELAEAIMDGVDLQEKAAFVDGFVEGFDLDADELEQSIESYAAIGAQLIVTIANVFLLRKNEEEDEDEAPVDAPDADADDAAE